jgi:hypothetical protein
MRKHCEADVTRFTTEGLTCPTCQKECNSQTAFLYHVATSCIQLPTEKQELLHGIIA